MQWMVTSLVEPITAEGIAIVNSIRVSTAGNTSPTNNNPFAEIFSVIASISPCSLCTCKASFIGKRTAVRTGLSPSGLSCRATDPPSGARFWSRLLMIDRSLSHHTVLHAANYSAAAFKPREKRRRTAHPLLITVVINSHHQPSSQPNKTDHRLHAPPRATGTEYVSPPASDQTECRSQAQRPPVPG